MLAKSTLVRGLALWVILVASSSCERDQPTHESRTDMQWRGEILRHVSQARSEITNAQSELDDIEALMSRCENPADSELLHLRKALEKAMYELRRARGGPTKACIEAGDMLCLEDLGDSEGEL